MRTIAIMTVAALATLSSAASADEQYLVSLTITKGQQFSYAPQLLVSNGGAPARAELKGNDAVDRVRIQAVPIGNGVFDVTTIVSDRGTELRPRLLVRVGQPAKITSGDVTVAVAVDHT